MTISTIELANPEDIVSFLAEETGAATQYRQFSRGLANLRYQIVDLDGVTLFWASGDAHALWRDCATSTDGIRLGFVTRAENEVLSRGVPVTENDAVVWVENDETEYLFKGPIETLEIVVHPEISRPLGWVVAGSVLRTAPSNVLPHLERVCRAATNTLQSQRDGSQVTAKHFWRGEILEAFELALAPWLDDRQAASAGAEHALKDYAHFRYAESAYYAFEGLSQHMGDLSRKVGVSRRKLELAFRKCAGVGPRRYFEVQRLHSLRRGLIDGHPNDTSVTRQAVEQGFSDLGRMAQKYRSLFGENPSDTLRTQRLNSF